MRQTQKPRIVNLLMLTVAGMINAFGITLFMTPVKLYDSGISGTSMLLEQITPSCLSLSFFLLVLNIPLFLVGLKKQGGLFTFYAIYTVGIYSLFAWLITDIFPIDVSIASPLAGPNNAHNNKSVPASGEAILTSIGKMSVISHANKE